MEEKGSALWQRILEKARTLLGGKNGPRLLAAAGILGMVLIGFSQVKPPGGEEPAPSPSAQETTSEYTQRLEERLEELVESMEGAGEARVMVTLEQGSLQMYAVQRKEDTQLEDDYDTGSAKRKDSVEESYLLVEDAAGRSQALPTTTVEPRIRGVTVVCEGAEDPQVAARVTQGVTTALGIGTNRVCVVRLSGNTTEKTGGH